MIPRLLGECWCNPLTWGEGQKTKSILTSEVYLKVDRFMGINGEHRTGVIYHQ